MSQPNPIIRYNFDSWTSGVSVTNEGSTSTVNNATLYNSAAITTSTSATGTKCLSLARSSNQYLSSNSSFYINNSSWTVSFWYQKQSSTVSEASDVRLFSIYNSINTTSNEISVGITGTSGYMYLTVNGTVVSFCNSNCCDGVWRHVTITYDNNANKAYFYFNGVLCSTSATCTALTDYSNLCIGTAGWGQPDTTHCATVLIDDFCVYNVCLTLTQIAYVCGNNKYYMNFPPVLINNAFNSYIPSTSQTLPTGLYTQIAKQNVDLSTLYAKYTSGTTCLTGLNRNLHSMTSLNNYFSADYGVIKNGNSVSTWKDLSGNNRNANAAVAPIYNPSDTIMNNKPCINFDGVTNNMYLSCSGFRSTNFTMCLAGYIIANTNQAHILASHNVWGVECFRLYTYNTAPIVQIFWGSFTSTALPAPFIITLTAKNVNATTTTITLYVNGSLTTSYDIGVSSNYTNINTLDIGAWGTQANSTFHGGISSLLTFNTLLTDYERQQIEGYLAWKWWDSGTAILTSSHPYYSTAPLTDIGTLFNPLNYS